MLCCAIKTVILLATYKFIKDKKDDGKKEQSILQMTLASSNKNTKPPIAMYYTCSLIWMITCTRLLVLQIHWNIYVVIIDVFCIVIKKLVGKGSLTCLEHELFKVKTPATIQTTVESAEIFSVVFE